MTPLRTPPRAASRATTAGLLAAALAVLAACGMVRGTSGTAAGPTSTPSSSHGGGTSTMPPMATTESSPPPTGGAASGTSVPVATLFADQVPGMPAATLANVYAHDLAGMLSPAVAGDRPLIYVPDTLSNDVIEIDPATGRRVRSFKVPALPQHVVPSWDLKTLWVNDDNGNELTPIDPKTGLPGRSVHVPDPYNLYFTPDGKYAVVMASKLRRLEFLDPHTMVVEKSVPVPCEGVNHADFSANGQYFIVSCEFSGMLLKVSTTEQKVLGTLRLGEATGSINDAMAMPNNHMLSMPQDVKLSPDGRTFYVADMTRDGVWMVDGETLQVVRFQPTGRGAHGLYPSRDSTKLYVSNRDEGSVTVLSFATGRPLTKWVIPGGGSPDMGGVSADGHDLWLSGRYHNVIYDFDTRTGRVKHIIRVGAGPHGLCVFPQPGRYSLGHTGVFR